MQYLKNALFVVIFVLCSLGLAATAPLHSISSNQETALDTPQGDGALEITQGRYGIRVKILVPGLVRLIVRDEAGEVRFSTQAQPERRRVNIPTTLYANGAYTLEGIHDEGVEVLNFTISEE